MKKKSYKSCKNMLKKTFLIVQQSSTLLNENPVVVHSDKLIAANCFVTLQSSISTSHLITNHHQASMHLLIIGDK